MPTVADVLQRGWQLHQNGNLDAAMHVYRGVLRQVPGSADAWVYLGIAQFDRREFAESAESYRRGLQLRSHFPIAWNNLGNTLRMLGETEEADRCFESALQQQPGYLSAFKNRGTLWIWSGQIERGFQWYEEGLKIDPENAELHRNLGVIHLLLGNYQRGFDEYRWRWKMPGVSRPRGVDAWANSAMPVPVWHGQELERKSICIYPEQGLGDAIHFVRVAAELKRRGARIQAVLPPAMIPLLSTAPGVDEIVPDDSEYAGLASTPLSPTDFHASFIEVLDGLFQSTGQVAWGSDLAKEGYLEVPEALIRYWKDWLDQRRDPNRKLVGINWQGNPGHHADVYRSIPLQFLRPLLDSNRVQVISLQFGHGVEQLDQSDLGSRVLRLPDGIDKTSGQFVDTAAVLKNLDAVVTTDTAIAHLAGALTVPTQLLLGRVPDWRWLTDGETTPWYASLMLSRQAKLGTWDDAVERVVKRLTGSPAHSEPSVS
ncbi:MAG: tetratricopeptide repeat-containing glycosyltransferase family protein [Planctomycetota bacterium]